MCNIGCIYEGFQGKCIKGLHGIPENIKPNECNKNKENISNVKQCINCSFYDHDEHHNYCRLINYIIYNPYSGCILNRSKQND